MPTRALLLSFLLAAPVASHADRGQQPAPSSPSALLPIDADAFEIAAATGGFYYFWQPGEFAALDPAASRHLFAPGQTVEQIDGSLDGTIDLPFEVEPGDAAITVRAGLQSRGRIELFAPDAHTPWSGAEDTRTAHMRIAHVPEPTPGTWTVRLTGEGVYLVNVTSQPRSAAAHSEAEAAEEPGEPAWGPEADLGRFRSASPDVRWDLFRRLPEARRRALARALLGDADPAVAYLAAGSLAREGRLDEAVPVFARILVRGEDRAALAGRMGYDWIHDDDETLAQRITAALARHLRDHLHEYSPAERERAERLLDGLDRKKRR
jgi:hypothetical protein